MVNDNYSDKDLILKEINNLNLVNDIKNIKNSNNILFCEDADVPFAIINNILSKTKYKVSQIKDGIDAYNFIINNQKVKDLTVDRDMICLIIMDLNISQNMNDFGYKILQDMKNKNIYIPTIIYSGSDDIKTVVKCMKLSPIEKDFFSKNINCQGEIERFLHSIDHEVDLFKVGKIQ